MLSVFNATFANVGGCEGALIAYSAATHLNSLTSNKPCPIFGDVERGGRRRGRRKRWVLIHHLRRNNSWPKETEGRR